MYVPDHFEEKDAAEIARIVEAFPLAMLVCGAGDDLIVNHIPLLREKSGSLVGHIARANTLHEKVEDGAPVVAVFRAEDSYVSPNWYPTNAATHRYVPTWNYQAVHFHGRISFDHSRKAKLAMVGKLTVALERPRFGEAAWKMADAPADRLEALLDDIVGFGIDVERVEAISKVSQNRGKVDFDNVAAKMDDEGKPALARRMRRIAAGKQGS